MKELTLEMLFEMLKELDARLKKLEACHGHGVPVETEVHERDVI